MYKAIVLFISALHASNAAASCHRSDQYALNLDVPTAIHWAQGADVRVLVDYETHDDIVLNLEVMYAGDYEAYLRTPNLEGSFIVVIVRQLTRDDNLPTGGGYGRTIPEMTLSAAALMCESDIAIFLKTAIVGLLLFPRPWSLTVALLQKAIASGLCTSPTDPLITRRCSSSIFT